MGTAAAVILMKERRIVEAFERAGATAPDRAVPPEAIGVDASGLGWRRLRDRAVIREATPGGGACYLDLDVWRALRRTRQRLVLVVLIVALAAAYLAYVQRAS